MNKKRKTKRARKGFRKGIIVLYPYYGCTITCYFARRRLMLQIIFCLLDANKCLIIIDIYTTVSFAILLVPLFCFVFCLHYYYCYFIHGERSEWKPYPIPGNKGNR